MFTLSRRLIRRLLVVGLLTLALTSAFAPRLQTPEDPTDLGQWLLWVGTASGAMAAAAFIVERVAWFQIALDTKKRGYAVLGLAVVIGLGSYVTYTYVPANILAQIAPFFRVVAGIVVAWLVSQWAHQGDPLAAQRRAARLGPPGG